MNLQAIRNQLILGLGVAIAPILVTNSAQAFTWTITNAPTDQAGIFINGNFIVDNENGAPPVLTASNIQVGTVTYGLAGLQTPLSNPLSGISWFGAAANFPGCTSLNCGFTLNFDQDLTTAGGTVDIALSTTFSQNGIIGGNANAGGTATASGGVTGTVPFDFSTTPGLIVLGLIVGGGKAKKHFPKIKKKIVALLVEK